MSALEAAHPSDQTLRALSLGTLDEAAAEVVGHHLEECSPCRRRVSEVSADPFLNRLRDAQPRAGASRSGSASSSSSRPIGGKPAPQLPPDGALPPELAEHPQYEILRELGRGGMGIVYLARNREMDRLEVLKILNQELLARRGTALERFLREIRTAARLNHVNVVIAYTTFEVGRLRVLAMEYVDGENLADLVKKRGPLPVPLACHFLYQAALGLQHAHEAGMIHRDIKPGNLMVARKGQKAVVKVLDFGLAKAMREGPVDSARTHEGQALGTPDYNAPEQIVDASHVDIRADIYSLGCTLYYILTGHPPFHGNTLYDIYQAHISTEAKPLNLIRPEVSPALAAVVGRMMAKEPQQRYQTPAEAAEALKPFWKPGAARVPSEAAATSLSTEANATGSATSSPAAPPPATRPAAEVPQEDQRWASLIDISEHDVARERNLTSPRSQSGGGGSSGRKALVAAAAVILLAVLAVVVHVRTKHGTLEFRDIPENAVVIVDGDDVRIEWPEGRGHGVARVSLAAGQHEVVVAVNGVRVAGETVTITTGKRVSFTIASRHELAPPPLKPSETSRSETSATNAPASGIAKPQGNPSSLPLAGTRAASADLAGEPNFWPGAENPEGLDVPHMMWFRAAMSPDLRTMVSQVTENATEQMVTLRLSVAPDGKQVAKTPLTRWIGYPAFSPDGRQFAASNSADNKTYVWDAVTGAILNSLPTNGSQIFRVVYSPDGRRIATGHADATVRIWDSISGRLLDTFVGFSSGVLSLAYSPDGKRLAAGSHPGANSQIPIELKIFDLSTGQTIDLDAQVERRPSADHGIWSVVFSPDGRYVAYGCSDWTVKVYDIAEGRRTATFARHSGTVAAIDFSPDGRFIASASHNENAVRLWEAATGKEAATLYGLRSLVEFVRFSGRGRWLYARSREALKCWEVSKVSAAFENPTPAGTRASAESGFVPLFNGKDLAGWSAWCSTGPLIDAERNATWSVRDGVIIGSGVPSHLYSPRGDYRDFRIRAEVKINDGGNSGLYFRAAKSAWLLRDYEAKINSTHRDPGKTGSLYRFPLAAIEVSPSPVPPDTWFTLEVEAVGNRIRVWVDGKQTIDWTDPHPLHRQGYFALQVLSAETRIAIRKLEVIELNPKAKPEGVAIVPSRASEPMKDSGFTALFNGKDLTGWTVVSGASTAWRVENENLVARERVGGRNRGFLLSDNDYSEFLLRFKFQMGPAASSGVTFWSEPHEFDGRLPNPLKIGLRDRDLPHLKTGSFFWSESGRPEDVVPPDTAAVLKPSGQWNSAEVEVRKNLLRATINGRDVLRTDLSKLVARPEAQVALVRQKGRIGFENHNGTVRFRDIEIRRLTTP